MLTEIKAYSSWRSAPSLPLSENGRAESDLIQVRNITGLDPVKASVNTTPYGAIDGASFTGSSVTTRNIVLTLGLNPDWNTWTYELLRSLLYSYFMPKRATRLIFYREEKAPVEIRGIVESAEVNMFSKDPEFNVSIVCPDPYFTSTEETIVRGHSIRAGGTPVIFDYEGSVETGIYLNVKEFATPAPTDISVVIGDPPTSRFSTYATVSATKYFELNSTPLQKFVQNVDMGSGIITNLLSKVHIQEGSLWPVLQPGEVEFSVVTDQGDQEWELVYFERFGGL